MRIRFYFSLLPAFLLPLFAGAQGGNVGIGTTIPNASAQLEVTATNKGLLPPRIALTGPTDVTTIPNPAVGLMVYNTTTGKLNIWDGTRWTAPVNTTEQLSAVGTSVNFSYSGAVQTYTVPPGASYIIVDASGAQGGSSASYNLGGKGGRMQATLNVTPGEVLNIYVGGAGTNGISSSTVTGGYNGGGAGGTGGSGGGGATDIRRGGTALSNRILVAAGGGGSGSNYGIPTGGAGGGTTGEDGVATTGYASATGMGATQSAGGQQNGALGTGGDAATQINVFCGGGGGGGYYGGGGASAPAPVGGGGGSSWITPTGRYGYFHHRRL